MAFWTRIDSVIIKKLVIFFVSYFGSRRKLTMPTMNIGLLVTSEERAPCSSLNKSRSVHRKGIIVEDLSFKFYDYWYLWVSGIRWIWLCLCVDFDVVGVLGWRRGHTVVWIWFHRILVLLSVLSVLYLEYQSNATVLTSFLYGRFCETFLPNLYYIYAEIVETWTHRRDLACYIALEIHLPTWE